jgi:predicted nucleic acid-binding protein
LTFFVDANVVVYSGVRDSPYREPCLEIMAAITRGEVDGRTSTAALEEVWHLELSDRVRELDGLTARAYAILGPLLPVSDEAFRRALGLDAPALGANDRLHVATCLTHGIDLVVSADQGFDSVPEVRRIDPLDGPARAALLES